MPDTYLPGPPIAFEGADSDNPLAYRWYDATRQVGRRSMKEHLRWAVCYWHSFCWPGIDMYGRPIFGRAWFGMDPADRQTALAKMDAAFAFMARLGAPYFTFHDVDVVEETHTLSAQLASLQALEDKLHAKMKQTGIDLLWGTANLVGHPRYAAGAATNPDPEIFACAAAQVRACLETTHRLGGANYVLWGGREGYDTLLNTDMGRELDQYGRFLSMVVDHKHRIGFKGSILLEPKPHEPVKHMYDHDVATVYGFLRRYGLESEIKVNIEVNHATLAGHSFEHEVATALALGIFGSIDLNRGDPQNGWDTDQFPNNVPDLALPMAMILKSGGFTTGGFNFDAKLRRQSIDLEDLLHAHIGGLDTLARALLAAQAMLEDRRLEVALADRYAGWDGEIGRAVTTARSLGEIADLAIARGLEPRPRSGRQEYLENLVNRFV